MKRKPYNQAKTQYAWKYNISRNFKEDKWETNSRVVSIKRRNKFQSWADGYSPMGFIQGRKGRSDRYKKHHIKCRKTKRKQCDSKVR